MGGAKEKLPENWKSAKTPEGKTYYYNKVTCTTSWEKPKLLRHEMEGVF